MMINLNQELIEAISQTVIHSLWQGIVIGFILFIALKKIDPKKAQLRYQLSLGALLSIFVLGLYTFLFFLKPDQGAEVIYQGTWKEVAGFLTPIEEGSTNLVGWFSEYNRYISNFWIAGVLLLSFRLLLGLFHISSISRSSSLSKNIELEQLLQMLKHKLGIEKTIQIFESKKTDSPITFGVFKSFILMPIGLVNQLTQEEVELILVHELGHITRNDFLVNIFQTIIETLFYYHPVVWWISHNAKVEREHVCDQLAISHSKEKVNYAKLLIKLQEFNLNKRPDLAMPFSSNPNEFSNRIKRILNMNNHPLNFKSKLIGAIMILSLFVFFSFKAVEDKTIPSFSPISKIHSIIKDKHDDLRIAMLPPMKIDTTPINDSLVDISISNNEETIELNVLNGEINELKVNGKEIPQDKYEEYEEMLSDMHIDLEEDNSLLYWNHEVPVFGDLPIHNDISDVFTFESAEFDSLITALSEYPDFGNLETQIKIFEDGVLKDFKIESNESFKKHLKQLEADSIDFRILKHQKRSEKQQRKLQEHLRMLGENSSTFYLKDMPDGTTRWIEKHGLKNEHKRPYIKVMPDGKTRWFNYDNEFPTRREFKAAHKPYGKLHRELNRDGLLEIDEVNKIQLSRKHLKINGDKQPKNIHHKYLRLYESYTGFPLNGKTKLEFELMGKKNSFPREI